MADMTQIAAWQRDASELARWRGVGATPQRGCHVMESSFGDATVMVEYEYTRAEPDRPNADLPNPGPGHPAEVVVLNVLINGHWISADDCIPEHIIERWQQEALENHE